MYIQIVERSISRTHFILNSWDSVCVCICSLYIQRTSICIQSEWVKSLSRVWLFATPWTVATRLLCTWDSPGPPPGNLPHPGIKLESLVFPALQADSLPIWEAPDKKRWSFKWIKWDDFRAAFSNSSWLCCSLILQPWAGNFTSENSTSDDKYLPDWMGISLLRGRWALIIFESTAPASDPVWTLLTRQSWTHPEPLRAGTRAYLSLVAVSTWDSWSTLVVPQSVWPLCLSSSP